MHTITYGGDSVVPRLRLFPISYFVISVPFILFFPLLYRCLDDGTWFQHPESNLEWSNYTTCVNVGDLEVNRQDHYHTFIILATYILIWMSFIVVLFHFMRSYIHIFLVLL